MVFLQIPIIIFPEEGPASYVPFSSPGDKIDPCLTELAFPI